MFKWPVCLVRVAWFASMACSLVNMPALMLVVRPLLCLLVLAFLLNGTCACGQFAVSKVAYGWIARAPPLTLSKKLWSLVHVGSGRIRAASIWLRAALFGGGMHLDVLFATQLAFFFLARKGLVPWLGLLVAALLPMPLIPGWFRNVSHGWDRTAGWKWTHSDSGCCLDLSSAGDIGQRQHVVGDAWRAWCLRRHMASERRDVQLDCLHDAAGCFRRINWHATRKFAASCAEARTLVCGATFSPAALGGRMPHRPSTMCIWDGCTELGTFDHIAWECARRSRNIHT